MTAKLVATSFTRRNFGPNVLAIGGVAFVAFLSEQSRVALLDDTLTTNEVMIHGECEPRFEPVAHVLRKQVVTFGGGGAVTVYLEGKCVVDIWAGQARRDGTQW